MENAISLSTVNRNAYSSSDVVKYYGAFDELFTTEKVLLESLEGEIRDSAILDLGVGGGRTTEALIKISKDYTGLDYSAGCVEIAAARHPEARIALGDARDLREFAEETFDFVLFSFNGLDALSNQDRLRALNEINRVLKAGGTFMFSSHNREYRYFRKLPWRRNIEYNAKFFNFLLYSLYHLPKHFRMKKHEVITDTYAVVNDSDHRYSLLLYYIAIQHQVKQLKQAGFSQIEAYDTEGHKVSSDDRSPWVYYLARKDSNDPARLTWATLLTVTALLIFLLLSFGC